MFGPKRPNQEELLEQVKNQMFDLDNPGFCTACGEWSRDDCEPDMEDGICPECDQPAVYGAEQVLLLTA
jgi:hypothetical protein